MLLPIETSRSSNSPQAKTFLHKSLYDRFPLLYLIVDVHGKVRTISPWGANRLGYTVNELEGSSVFLLFSQAQRTVVQHWISNLFKRRASYDVSPKTLSKVQLISKTSLMFSAKLVAVRLNDPDTSSIALLCENLIEENENFIENEAWFYSLANALPIKLYLFSSNGECTFINQSWLEFTGQSTQPLGKKWIEQMHPFDRKRYQNKFISANKHHQQFNINYRLKQANGDYCTVTHTAIPRLLNENFLGYIAYAVEVSKSLELQKIDAAIDEFSNRIIYQLRVPVTNMKLALEMLKMSLDPHQNFLAQLNDELRRERVATYFQVFCQELQQQAEILEDLSLIK